MLALIGTGLDAGDISVRALKFIKDSDIVLADRFTSIISKEAMDLISRETGKEIKSVTRSDLEENVRQTIHRAKSSNVSILVIGDPLVATTHHTILDAAHAAGIKTKIFHSSSIFSAAIGESGLDIYRFGPTTTVPFWSEHYKPTSFIDTISKNLKNSEHTLLLLDIEQSKTAPMSIAQAADIISKADGKAVISRRRKVMALADIGRENQEILYIEFSKIPSLSSRLEGKTISLIIPADLNFAEEESVKKFWTSLP